ncbi:MAG: hypothetical protein JKY49_10395 [Cohaesibacteraceae bacterium]|nr:hypothetical protein [Cohaesibacteraceae bacterium]MBL4876314.1 hypothetical protein [Cohaesibacteraceae bacterium]
MQDTSTSTTTKKRIAAFLLLGIAALIGPLFSMLVFELSITQMVFISFISIALMLIKTINILVSPQDMLRHLPDDSDDTKS